MESKIGEIHQKLSSICQEFESFMINKYLNPIFLFNMNPKKDLIKNNSLIKEGRGLRE